MTGPAAERCPLCGADVVLVLVIPEQLRRGAKRVHVPLDVGYTPYETGIAPSHAVSISGITCRPITTDHPLLIHENPALTHFATCPARRSPEEVFPDDVVTLPSDGR